MQLTKTVERFLTVHLVLSDFNHFSINVVFFRAQCYLQKINVASFGLFRFAKCKIWYVIPLFLLREVKYIYIYIYFEIFYIFRGYKKGALESNVLNTNFMRIRKTEFFAIKVMTDPCLVVLCPI